jgi:hypothetical protein
MHLRAEEMCEQLGGRVLKERISETPLWKKRNGL